MTKTSNHQISKRSNDQDIVMKTKLNQDSAEPAAKVDRDEAIKWGSWQRTNYKT